MFSWPNKLEHASVGRNEPSVELARKNLAVLRCKYFREHQNKKLPLPLKKTFSASVCKRNCASSAERYQSGTYNDRHRPLFILFIPE